MVALALHYPQGGHGGRSFWKVMTELYGESLLKDKNAGALRERWRKIARESGKDLEVYSKGLADKVAKEFAKQVEKTINDTIAEPVSLLAGTKRHSALLPNIFKDGEIPMNPMENGKDLDRKVSIKKSRKKKAFSNVVIGKDSKFPESIRTCLNFSQITAKKSMSIYRMLKKNGFANIDSDFEQYFATKDFNPFIQEILKSKKTVEPDANSLPKLEAALGNNMNGTAWSELEDLALRHQESAELQSCLIRSKGETAVASRKKALGL
eukprot:TRINITY_DN2806_c0_g1_i6.p1 TRINITY_DN2806_c0_g1~~TRINITY_DN2806_c0_g1_i6.p1  ORF type:complete len:311 (-),score=75.21 TRINITY_DN2806_c0_g1_i6:123-920(-)